MEKPRMKFSKEIKLQRMQFFMKTQLEITQMKHGKRTTSRRLADRKVERFEKNITKRGAVPETTTKKGNEYPVGPIVLGFFVFVVIGSSIFQIIRTATSGGMA
ncbi:hypothetical protein HHK36_007585 [Tetracentron sinense]|uniref:Stress-associated endoplasmic reticulum protein 2-like n=1 Tax=Tetracentron sinense TaxID=13715 RepID=A0A835DLL5_TETSI|nr:hypothetical protein HHK36_007585 [Tetracentron sinense]